MNRRIVIIGIIVAVALAFLSVGFAAWGIVSSQSGEATGDFVGYTVIDLDKVTNSAPAFYYNSSGFYDDGYSYETTFNIRINAPEKNEPYNLTITLIDQDNFLSTAGIVSSSNRDNETGNRVITIENISSAISFDVSYSILSDANNYSSIYSNLSSKKITLNITATTANGSWTIDKNINLVARIQNLVFINKPDPDVTVFTYTGAEQTYSVAENSGYTVTGNIRTNAGNQIVTISLNDGYAWSDNSQDDLEYTFTINKATPILSGDVTVNYPENRSYAVSSDTELITLSGTFINPLSSTVDGNIQLDNVSTLTVGDNSYSYVFIPTDSDNYNNASGNVNILVYATVRFMYDSENVLGVQFVPKNTTIEQANIPVINDSECKTYYNDLITYQYKPSFSNWENFSSSTVILDDLDVFPNITQELRSYNFTIYYKDKDNQVSLVKTNSNAALTTYSTQVYDFAARIGATNVSSAIYDTTNISLAKQIRLAESYTYYSKADTTATRYINAFYMSPVDSFVWSDLATGYNANGYTVTTNNYIAYINDDDIMLLVLCVQPEAIITKGAISNTTTFNYSTSSALFYADMNEAFNACAGVTSTTYLRIYGQARYAGNTFAYHCYNADTNIAQYTYTIDGHTFTIPKYKIFALTDYKLANDYTINSYLNVILPYGRDDTTTTGYNNCQTAASAIAGSYVQSILDIPNGKTLTVNGTLSVGGWITGEGAVGAHATLRNNGTINVTSSGKIYSFGYINGAGIINLASGATLTDVFRIYNWPGGANALGMYNKDLFPFDAFSFHNVSCRTQINYGSYYKAWIQLYMSSNWQTKTAQTIVGSGGLFELTSSSSYIIKSVEDTTYATNTMQSNASFTSSNQFITQREVIEAYGDFKDNAITLTIMGQSVSTSTSLPLPIGFFKINVMGGTGILSSNSYKFLPGSCLYIEEGAIVNIASNVKIIFFDETQYVYSYKSSSSATPVLSSAASSYGYIYLHRSKYGSSSNPYLYGGIYDSDADFVVIDGYESGVIVNGTLNCSGTLAGRIDTTSENGQVILSKASYTFDQLATLTYGSFGSTATVASTTMYPKLNLYSLTGVSSVYTNVGTGTYYSIKDANNNYGWYSTSGTISYNVNGGSGSFSNKTIAFTSSGYTITASDVSNTPTRNHYSFGGWYLDSACTQLAQGSVVYCSVTLYAKWNVKNYNIVYDFDQLFDNSATDGTQTNNANNPSTYNIESSITLYQPTYYDYVFDGWYSDSSYTNKISSIIGSSVIATLSSPYTYTLYGRWYPSDTETYTITYVNDNTDDGCTCAESEEVLSLNISNYVTPNLSGKNTNTTYNKYFDGWYLDSSYNTKYTSTSQIMGDTTLYAKWIDKNIVNVCYEYQGAQMVLETRYLEANRTFTIPDVSSYVEVATGYEIKWIISGGDLDGNTYSTGDTICLSTGWGNEIYASATVVAKSYTLTIKCGTNETLTYVVYVGNTSTQRSSDSVVAGATKNDIQVYTDDKVTVSVSPASGYNAGSASSTNMTGTGPYFVNGEGNPTITIANASKASSGCLLPNTLITMADGTQKEIKSLVFGDMVLVFNHETGQLDVAPVTFNEFELEQWFNVIHLVFDSGSNIGVISEHGFFDLDTMKYEYIDESNYQDFIGHRFYTIDGISTTLIDAYVEEEYTMCYSLPSYYHLNLFTEGILSMPGGISGLFNIFDYSDNLQYDQEKMIEDINTYGLFTIEEFAEYGVTEEMFNAYAGQYLKVALGKGILTEEYLMYLIERYGKYTE